MGLAGFTDKIFDIPHVTAARDLFIGIPEPETDRLASLAHDRTDWLICAPNHRDDLARTCARNRYG
jgi:hypothetical protein